MKWVDCVGEFVRAFDKGFVCGWMRMTVKDSHDYFVLSINFVSSTKIEIRHKSKIKPKLNFKFECCSAEQIKSLLYRP